MKLSFAFALALLCTVPVVYADSKSKSTSRSLRSSDGRSEQRRSGSGGTDRRKKRNKKKSYVAAPTIAPILERTFKSSSLEAPTFAPVMQSQTKGPTFNFPVSSTWYSFTTPEGTVPTMNAATKTPDAGAGATTEVPGSSYPSDTATFSPTMDATLSPTFTGEYTWWTPPVASPTLAAQTASPKLGYPTLSPTSMTLNTDGLPDLENSSLSPTSMNFGTGGQPTFDYPTMTPTSTAIVNGGQPDLENSSLSPTTITLGTGGQPSFGYPSLSPMPNTTGNSKPSGANVFSEEPTISSDFSIDNEGLLTTTPSIATNSSGVYNGTTVPVCGSKAGSFFLPKENNRTDRYELDVFTFTYELETYPRTEVDDVLPALEIALVDSVLDSLFPSECQATVVNSKRLLQSDNANIVGITADPADEATGFSCEATVNPKVNACELIFGKISIFSTDGDTKSAMEIIQESLTESMDNGDFTNDYSIARISYSFMDILVDESDGTGSDAINGEKDGTQTEEQNGSMIGIGLSLSVAGVLLLIVGASAYRKKHRVLDHEVSTIPGGSAAVNGLSRFDYAPSDEVNESRELKVIPLSPATSCRYPNNETE